MIKIEMIETGSADSVAFKCSIDSVCLFVIDEEEFYAEAYWVCLGKPVLHGFSTTRLEFCSFKIATSPQIDAFFEKVELQESIDLPAASTRKPLKSRRL